MPEFNLLPWREQRRALDRQRFFHMLVGLVCGMALLLWGGDQLLRQRMATQQRQNAALQQQLVELDPALTQLRGMHERGAEAVQHSAMLQQLAEQRAQNALLLDSLARMLPTGAYYTALSRAGATLRLEGMATGDALTALLQTLEASPQFAHPELRAIAAPQPDVAGHSAFVLMVPLSVAAEATR
jgi:Tfp pilus assembly protein PilN